MLLVLTGAARLTLTLALAQPAAQADSKAGGGPSKSLTQNVVFVCEHGSVKSVMAMQWFNRMADERRLPFRAVSRSGVVPDKNVPPPIADSLKADGFDVSGFTPAKLGPGDFKDAIQIVSIGLDEKVIGPTGVAPLDIWTDIPAASVDYKASRDALRKGMEALLDRLAQTAKARPAPKPSK